MPQCPKCDSTDVHRSRSKSRWEIWRKEITGKRPYRCRACGWRSWHRDTGPTFDQRDIELAARAIASSNGRESLETAIDLADLDPVQPSRPKLEDLDE